MNSWILQLKEQLILVMAARKAELEDAPAVSQAISSKPSQWLEDTGALSGFAKKKNQSSERGCNFPKAIYLAGKKGHLVQMGICPLVNSGISNDSSFHFYGGHSGVGGQLKGKRRGQSEQSPRKHCDPSPAWHWSDLEVERDKGADSPDVFWWVKGRGSSQEQLAFLQQQGLGDKQINADTRLYLMS